MQFEVVEITQENIHSFAGLYIDVFNQPPWNDGWSKTAVLERFQSFAAFPRFRGLGYLTAGHPTALVFGWGERWTNGWNFHVREMCVAVPLQRGGFGKRLLLAFEKQLFAEGFKSVFLETGQAVAARKFYEGLGYKNLSLVSLSKNADA
jgi:aminoglycoside 6'-N-acetyltransferase I